MKNKFFSENKDELLSALILAFTLFFFAPLSVYLKNVQTVDFTFGDIWYLYLVITLIVFIALLALSLIIKRVFPCFAIFYLAASFGFILQGNYLNYNLGALDGHNILWESFRVQSWLELLLWTAIFVIFIVFRKTILKHFRFISLFIIIYLLVSNSYTVLANPTSAGSGTKYWNYEREFQFSNTKNVILIILDTFRTEAFDRILEKYPEYREVFKDFELFPDTVGGYPTTLPSIPLILTGKYYDDSVPITEFINNTQDESIAAVLKRNGFIVENYPFAPFYSEIYDNYSSYMPIAYKKFWVILQYWVSAIRYMPLVLKPYFVDQYYNGQIYYHKDIVDFESRLSGTRIIDGQPIFKLIHVSGAHPPFQLDSNLNRGDKGYIEQATACLKIVADMLSKLRQVGAYDNSLIIIMGDHGSEEAWDYSGDPLVYTSQTLLLAKRIGQHFDKLHFSDKKVSVSDIPLSVVDELGIQNTYQGYSIFKDIRSDRTRIWYFYSWQHSAWYATYLPTMYEFEIIGPAEYRNSYRLIKIINGNSDVENIKYTYHYGENAVETLLSDNIQKAIYSTNFYYETSGDQFWSWASGPEACIYLPVQPTSQQLELSLRANPYLIPKVLDKQTIEINIDHEYLGAYVNNGNQDILIPSEMATTITSDREIDLCFKFPDAKVSPSGYGVSNDMRLLGYNFTSLVIK